SLGHPDDWDVALGPGGALEAAVEARRQGLVRFIGVTGHGWTIPAMHRKSLARFDFDSVLLPSNFLFAQNERYRKAFDEVLATCRIRKCRPCSARPGCPRSSASPPDAAAYFLPLTKVSALRAPRSPRRIGRTPASTPRPRAPGTGNTGPGRPGPTGARDAPGT